MQQYTYIERLESLLGSMQRERFGGQMRADLQLLHLGKPLPGEGQRLAALKARSAIAARCQQGLQVNRGCTAVSVCDCHNTPFEMPPQSYKLWMFPATGP